MVKTIVLNFIGGPGCGKSTTAARVFAHFKMALYKCELVTEYAKDLTYQASYSTLSNQIYVFGKQHQRMERLKGKVDLIITDSPLPISLIYCPPDYKHLLSPLVLHEYHKYDNILIHLSRTKEYQAYGRNQTEQQAKQVDIAIQDFLFESGLEYHDFNYPVDADLDLIVKLVNQKLNA